MSFAVPFLRVKPLSTPLLGQNHPFQAMASNRALIPMSQTCNALHTPPPPNTKPPQPFGQGGCFSIAL